MCVPVASFVDELETMSKYQDPVVAYNGQQMYHSSSQRESSSKCVSWLVYDWYLLVVLRFLPSAHKTSGSD